ncbi:hypothetical protein [Nocardia sp. NPDC049149]|uniref:hypothetical protein n=1 Tax=Nocardia sp. NPDC049149 TaxID=3364315 RepID=UPI00371E6609
MMKDVAAPGQGGLAVAVAWMADRVGAEWTAGLKRLASTWSRRGEPELMDARVRPDAKDLLVQVDPLVAVRWRGSW